LIHSLNPPSGLAKAGNEIKRKNKKKQKNKDNLKQRNLHRPFTFNFGTSFIYYGDDSIIFQKLQMKIYEISMYLIYIIGDNSFKDNY
jgi:hypothetical protein